MAYPKKKVAFHTLGCKLNFAESSAIARSLPPERFERVTAEDAADIYIINTCSVTDAADKKCRQAIRKFIHRSPGAFIAVVGCYSQLKPQEIATIPGVDLVLGSNEKFDLASYLEAQDKHKHAEVHSGILSGNDRFYPSFSSGDRTRSFLKVQDGCDYGCSYCTIPMARGKSRNPSIGLLMEEARKIADQGIKEIVLTGVNIGDFGRSTGETFTDLLKELVNTRGIERIRLSSVEPNLLTDEIIGMVATGNKLLPHFHIPLQSGSNKILGLMKRRYRREVFAGRVYKIRELMPFAGIGADVITGFPGETDADFKDTFDFLEGLPLSYLHVFSYSERPGTVAEGLPMKVPPGEKELRSHRLAQLSDLKTTRFCELNTGRKAMVLFEKEGSENIIAGFTENYIRAEHPFTGGLDGTLREVILTGISESGNMTCEIKTEL
ncbi:MAG TPA: tRNA (N(6)-L-threonylcarbamoyladenosine(37)-C(2))-methylthiotransferase MtaB [Bacteroidales bacterium]|nr:tRNA (N(6)-L-threonylcarbamoyladenosine(37)-C(2))-methylthiotransferase MtaB [Bacteroidales bacterium]